MLQRNLHGLVILAAAVLTTASALGQSEIQMRARQLPGWDVRAREGRCEIQVWVDNRAEVRMRGDTIYVRTLEGSKSRDLGSQCSQPFPYNSVRGFQIRQTTGRSRLAIAQEPSRMNNFTAMIAIEDTQGGGDNYAFEVSWLADPDVANAAAPFYDEVRACQDVVRQKFVTQNGRGSYIDFQSFADRGEYGQDRSQGNSGNGKGDGNARRNQNRNQNRRMESIQGVGSARRFSEQRDLGYSCVIDTQQNQVVSGDYRYTSEGLRSNDRQSERRLR